MPNIPTARHLAIAADVVTGGPMHQRDIVARVAQLAADLEAAHPVAADTEHARTRRLLAADALANPRMAAFATELRTRGWRPPAGFSCGCNPATGLCPSHTALRDVEAATVTA